MSRHYKGENFNSFTPAQPKFISQSDSSHFIALQIIISPGTTSTSETLFAINFYRYKRYRPWYADIYYLGMSPFLVEFRIVSVPIDIFVLFWYFPISPKFLLNHKTNWVKLLWWRTKCNHFELPQKLWQ